MTEDANPGETTRKRSSRPLLLVACIVSAILLLVFALPPQGRSQRTVIVDRLMQAAKSKDESGFAALITPDAKQWWITDLVDRLNAANLRELIGTCRVLGSTEGLDTVSLEFDCARDANGQFFLDFKFCGEKVHRVSWPEHGRRLRSPVPRDLVDRAYDLLGPDTGGGTCPQ